MLFSLRTGWTAVVPGCLGPLLHTTSDDVRSPIIFAALLNSQLFFAILRTNPNSWPCHPWSGILSRTPWWKGWLFSLDTSDKHPFLLGALHTTLGKYTRKGLCDSYTTHNDANYYTCVSNKMCTWRAPVSKRSITTKRDANLVATTHLKYTRAKCNG